MKAATLASLLVTSAAVGAGATAVGGPFFLAVTVPFVERVERSSFTFTPSHPVANNGWVATFTASTPMVVRELKSHPALNTNRTYLSLLNPATGSRELVSVLQGTPPAGSWDDGIVVPRNHQLEVLCTLSGANNGTPYDVWFHGYRY